MEFVKDYVICCMYDSMFIWVSRSPESTSCNMGPEFKIPVINRLWHFVKECEKGNPRKIVDNFIVIPLEIFQNVPTG